MSNNRADNLKKVTYTLNDEKFRIYDYYVPTGTILGIGAYGVVIEAKDTRFNGRHVAIKKNRNVFVDLSDAKRILRETNLLMTFSHDDIIKLYEVIPPDHCNQSTFNDVYLVMPRMETTLKKIILSDEKLENKHYLFFIYQILRGLKYIHSADIIHRDLKPENILVNCKNCNVKISDFGLSQVDMKGITRTEYVVTRWYRAPEVMLCAKNYDKSVDMWAIGCIFAELIIRLPIFPGNNHCEQLQYIFNILGTPLKHDQLQWITSEDAKKYILHLPFQKGCDLRKIFKQCNAEEIDLIKNMLQINPKNRINVNQALSHPYFVAMHDRKSETVINKNEFNKRMKNIQCIEKEYKSIFGIRHLMYQTLRNFNDCKAEKLLKRERLVKTDRTSNEKIPFRISPLNKPPDSC